MNTGEMPAVVAEHIAAKHNLPMQAILNGTMVQDPHASYWKVEVDGPHGSLICVPVSDQMMLAGGVSANKKYGLTMTGMPANLDLTAWKAFKHAEIAKLYGAGPVKVMHGINAALDDYKAQIKAQLAHKPLAFQFIKTEGGSYECKMHKAAPAYDPPCKPAKVGQQISLDI